MVLKMRKQRFGYNSIQDPLTCSTGHNIRGASACAHILVTPDLHPFTPAGEKNFRLLIQEKFIPEVIKMTSSTTDPISFDQVAIVTSYWPEVRRYVEDELRAVNLPFSDVEGQMNSHVPCVAVDDHEKVASGEWTFVIVLDGGDSGDSFTANYLFCSRARSKLMCLWCVKKSSTWHQDVFGENVWLYKSVNNALEQI